MSTRKFLIFIVLLLVLVTPVVSNGFLNVTKFGADPSGENDSQPGINAALMAAPDAGSGIFFPPGDFRANSTVTIGNGGASGASSRYGVHFVGEGLPIQTFGFQGFPTTTSVRIFWGGPPGGVLLRIAGPLQGWGLENLVLDGSGAASTCLDVVSGQFGGTNHVNAVGCTRFGILSRTISSAGVTVTHAIHNHYDNTYVSLLPSSPSATCFVLTGNGTTNTLFNTLTNTGCVTTAAGQEGYYFQMACGNVVTGWQVSGPATLGVTFDYSVAGGSQPCNNTLLNGQPQSAGNSWIGNGGTTPGPGAKPNYLHDLITTDGAAYPVLPNLITDAR